MLCSHSAQILSVGSLAKLPIPPEGSIGSAELRRPRLNRAVYTGSKGGDHVDQTIENLPKHPMNSGDNHSPECWVASLTTSPSDGVMQTCGNAARQGKAGDADWVRSRLSRVFRSRRIGFDT